MFEDVMQYQQTVASMYDGGWRFGDEAEMVKEYNISEEDARAIGLGLEEMDEDVKLREALSEIAEEDSASYWRDEAEVILETSEVPASLMDDDIREHLHEVMAPCKDVTFVAAYLAHHKFKYGEDFAVV